METRWKNRRHGQARLGAATACAAYVENEDEILDGLYGDVDWSLPEMASLKRMLEKAWVDGYVTGSDAMMHTIAKIEQKSMGEED